jgi:hypothetical protein
MRSETIDDEVLQVRVGIFASVMLHEANQAVLAESLREIVQRCNGHASLFLNLSAN